MSEATRGRRCNGYIGIDVHANRGCPYVVLDSGLNQHASGWLEKPERALAVLEEARGILGPVAVGIDAPRCSLSSPRSHYWSGGVWRPRRPTDKGRGRHCEVVLAALRLANPQWTPLAHETPEWMQTGYQLYETLSACVDVYEVFPTASYHQLAEDPGARFGVSLMGFRHGPKDMLDAYVAAFTVHEYLAGRGAAVGGGDGQGTIILPRPILARDQTGVLTWPSTERLPSGDSQAPRAHG